MVSLHLFDFCDILTPQEIDAVYEINAEEVLREMKAWEPTETSSMTTESECDDTVLLMTPETVAPLFLFDISAKTERACPRAGCNLNNVTNLGAAPT
jgi:hypothetical protein